MFQILKPLSLLACVWISRFYAHQRTTATSPPPTRTRMDIPRGNYRNGQYSVSPHARACMDIFSFGGSAKREWISPRTRACMDIAFFSVCGHQQKFLLAHVRV